VGAKLRDQGCDPVEVVFRQTNDDGRTFCDLKDAGGNVEELPLVLDIESRHLATRRGTVARIGKGGGTADWGQIGVCVGRRGLESSNMGETRCELWAGCVVKWLRKGPNERGHDGGWKVV